MVAAVRKSGRPTILTRHFSREKGLEKDAPLADPNAGEGMSGGHPSFAARVRVRMASKALETPCSEVGNSMR
jgi:hypothetical protein